MITRKLLGVYIRPKLKVELAVNIINRLEIINNEEELALGFLHVVRVLKG